MSAVTIVVIAPTENRKERLSCFVISDAMTAAWPEPMPGRNEQRGAAIAAEREVFRNCFFWSFIFLNGRIFCFVSFAEEVFNERIRAEEPKSPVRRGRSGSLIGRLNVRIPKIPARRKIVIEERKFSSLKIK